MKVTIYLEGGGDWKELHTRCREGFRKLLEQCGYAGRMPKLVACGGRSQTFDDFCTAHRISKRDTIQNALVHATRNCGEWCPLVPLLCK